MAKRFLVFILLLSSLGSIYSFKNAQANRQAQMNVSSSKEIDRAFDATVLITMYGFGEPEQQTSGIASEMIQSGTNLGLGTVVIHDGQELIVTHDHWNILNEELELVQFRNCQQQLLAQVTGNEFLELIRYQDGGTMILSKPARIGSSVGTVSLSTGEIVEKGTIVQVVHRIRNEQGGISAVDATVEMIEEKDGVYSLRLRSLNGHIIVPGDSGGGIWFKGQLIGNLWTTLSVNIKATESSQANTTSNKMEENWSRAAMLTNNVQNQLVSEEGLHNQTGESQTPSNMTQESGVLPTIQSGQIG